MIIDLVCLKLLVAIFLRVLVISGLCNSIEINGEIQHSYEWSRAGSNASQKKMFVDISTEMGWVNSTLQTCKYAYLYH